MNGYKLLSDAYKTYLLENEVTDEKKNHIEKKIKALDIVAQLDGEDVLALYGTGVFNNITLGYAEKAMRLQHLSRGRIDDVLDAIRLLHDTMGAEIAAS